MKGWTHSALAAKGVDLPPVSAAAPASPAAARTNARNTGKAFERELEQTAGAYHSLRIAVIKKVDPPLRVLWIPDKANPGKRKQHVVFLSNPWSDFAGTWTAHHGRMLIIEAKSTATHRLPMRPGHLSDEQRAALNTWHLAGAAVCVLWQWSGRVCLITPDMIIAAEARGDKSMVFEACLPVLKGDGALHWDFLTVLEMKLQPQNPPS